MDAAEGAREGADGMGREGRGGGEGNLLRPNNFQMFVQHLRKRMVVVLYCARPMRRRSRATVFADASPPQLPLAPWLWHHHVAFLYEP